MTVTELYASTTAIVPNPTIIAFCAETIKAGLPVTTVKWASLLGMLKYYHEQESKKKDAAYEKLLIVLFNIYGEEEVCKLSTGMVV